MAEPTVFLALVFLLVLLFHDGVCLRALGLQDALAIDEREPCPRVDGDLSRLRTARVPQPEHPRVVRQVRVGRCSQIVVNTRRKERASTAGLTEDCLAVPPVLVVVLDDRHPLDLVPALLLPRRLLVVLPLHDRQNPVLLSPPRDRLLVLPALEVQVRKLSPEPVEP